MPIMFLWVILIWNKNTKSITKSNSTSASSVTYCKTAQTSTMLWCQVQSFTLT